VMTLRNNRSGETITDTSLGVGPVDAVYKAIDQIVGVPNVLSEYLVQAITESTDANGDVTVRIETPESRGYKETAQGRPRRRLFSGRGVDTDIIVASAKAYLQALNKLLAAQEAESSTLNIAENASTSA
jgi:2-isopropylmalate synthase